MASLSGSVSAARARFASAATISAGGAGVKGGEKGGRAGDDGRVEARNAGCEKRAKRAGDFIVRRRRIVVVDAGEAVHLDVDEARSDVNIARQCVIFSDREHHVIEGDLDRIAGFDVDAGTSHDGNVLFTRLPQSTARKCMFRRAEKLVEKQKWN